MGIFSNLGQEKYDRQYSDRQLVDRIYKYFLPYRRLLIWVSVNLLIIAGTSAALPVIVSNGLDVLETGSDATIITYITLAVLIVGLISWGSNWIRRRLMARLVGDVVLTLQSDAFQAAAEHDLSFYDEFSVPCDYYFFGCASVAASKRFYPVDGSELVVAKCQRQFFRSKICSAFGQIMPRRKKYPVRRQFASPYL